MTETLEEDLEEVALAWQTEGIALWSKRPSERTAAAPIVLGRPWLGRRVWKAVFPHLFQAGASGAYGRLIQAPTAG